MTPTELRRLLRQRERAKVDFKRELSTRSKDDKAAFVKDVIALTNTQGGDGRLVVGIDDETRQVVPGHHVGTIEALDRVTSQNVRPPIRIDPELVKLDGVPVTVLALRRQARDLPYSVRKAVGGNARELRLDEWWAPRRPTQFGEQAENGFFASSSSPERNTVGGVPMIRGRP